jgi:hypothetical protein
VEVNFTDPSPSVDIPWTNTLAYCGRGAATENKSLTTPMSACRRDLALDTDGAHEAADGAAPDDGTLKAFTGSRRWVILSTSNFINNCYIIGSFHQPTFSLIESIILPTDCCIYH